MSLFNTKTEKTILCKPGHEGCSVKSGAVDPNGKFVFTTGSDGHFNVYKFNDAQDQVEFVTKFKICDRRVPADNSFDLSFQVLDDGETILIPG